MHTDVDLTNLRRVRAYYDEHLVGLLPSYRAFRLLIVRRRKNGLEEAGAVIKTSIGLCIDDEKFRRWLLERTGDQKAA